VAQSPGEDLNGVFIVVVPADVVEFTWAARENPKSKPEVSDESTAPCQGAPNRVFGLPLFNILIP
jgi:hypothetical protein